MSARIRELDLDAPLPAAVPLHGRDRLWLVGWRDGRPLGAVVIEPARGRRVIPGERIAREVARFRHADALRATAADGAAPSGLAEAAAAGGARPGPLRGRHGDGAPSVSVIICTRDRPDRLRVVFDGLRRQTRTGFELVVVDNSPSDDETRRVVLERWPEATYLVDPVVGVPHARNAGAHAARGEVLAFIDDDCRPVPGWVDAIAGAFTRDPGLGAVTGPILPLELETRAQEALERRGGFNRGFDRRRFTLDDVTDGPHPVQAWQFGAGGNFAASRRCLEAVDGFDEALDRSEDIDFLYRVVRSGRPLVFEPAVAVHHRHPPRWRQLRRRMFNWGWGYLTFLDKVARADSPGFAARARREKRNWLGYQLRDRLVPALRGDGDSPLELVLAELTGGLVGYGAYGRARRRAARRDATRAPPPVDRADVG